LGDFDNEATVSIAFVNQSGWGNNLYIDNINIQSAVSCGLMAQATVPNNVSCNGDCDGSASAVVTNGSTTPSLMDFQWSNGMAGTGMMGVNGLCAGTYTVTVTDVDGCQATATATVTEPSPISATVTSTDVSCNGGADGSATVTDSGGTPPYTYQWSDTAAQTTATATGLAAGTYGVTCTDRNGCTATTTETITEPIPLTLFVNSTATTCVGNDGTATVDPAGGTGLYTYLWDAAAGNQTVETLAGLSPGTYVVTVTDANGCTASESVTVADGCTACPLDLQTGQQAQTSCSGVCDATISATVLNGATTPSAMDYQWSNGMGGTGIMTLNNLCGGTYVVTVTDVDGCTASATFTVTEPSPMSATITSTDVSCSGAADGSATVTDSGGTPPYTYLWSDGQTTATATGLPGGSFSITCVDANGCEATGTVTINEPSPLTLATTGTPTTCAGNDGTATVDPAGGTGGYTYLWDMSAGNQTVETVAGLSPGTYVVTVTDANGCEASESITITDGCGCENTSATIQSTTDASCPGACDGTATADASSGTAPFTYAWTDGQSTATATGLCTGTYVVTITDATGCTASATATISEPISMTLFVNSTATTCAGNDGTAIVDPAGGVGPYLFLWDVPAGSATVETATNLPPGTYTVTVTDANGCTASESVTVGDGCTASKQAAQASAMRRFPLWY
jgi:hypothetical protein